MQNKTHYANGQKVFEQKGSIRTHFLKTGIVKARGKFVNGVMDGRWIFNRENGQLWQVGNFKKGKREGSWVRYDRAGKKEYEGMFKGDRLVAKSVFPKIGAPAERALQAAGITKIEHLTKFTEQEMLSLHGIGPKAVTLLKKALKAKKLALKAGK